MDWSGRLGRRTVLRGLTGPALATGLGGCQALDGGDDEPLEVFHNFAGRSADAMASLVEGFRAAHPDVEIETASTGGGSSRRYRLELDRRFEEGTVPGSFYPTAGDTLGRYGNRLSAVDTEAWDPATIGAVVDPTVATTCTRDGERVAVPVGTPRVNTLYYNPDVLASAGVDPDALTTVPALLEAVDAVASETDAVPFGQSLRDPWATILLVETILVAQTTVRLHRLATEWQPQEAALRRAFETAARLVPAHSYDDARYTGMLSAGHRLAEGEAAFQVTGTWLGNLLQADGMAYGEAWDARPFPGTEDSFLLGVRAFCRPAESPTPSATRKWLSYVGSSDGQRRFCGPLGMVPARMDVSMDAFDPFTSGVYEQFLATAGSRSPSIALELGVSPQQFDAVATVVRRHFHGDTYDPDAAARAVADELS